MKTNSRLGIILLAALMLLGQVGLASAGSDAKTRAAIDAANKKFAEAVAKSDASALAALYAEDAWLLPPGSDIVKGREAIHKVWQGVLAGVKSVKMTTHAMDIEDDLVVEVGTATLIGADGKELETVKYITVWKRVKKQWLIQRDIWNSNAPPAAK